MMIGTTIRQYRIIAELTPGKGGMGDLYLAEHVHLPKKFAIKCVKPALTQDPRMSQRFFQEAQDQALLDHPNIVQAIDFFEEGGQFFFVMQFVQGQDLDSLIKKQGKLTEEEALRIFEGILQGLKFAHDKGIVHRDMKPSNVMIDAEGRPRITDFGIAILAGAQRITSTGTAIGTPWYMSPEQILHPGDVDRRSDIYSAGIVLYEMLTGDVPFDGETDFTIKEQQVNSPAPSPRLKNPDISGELAQIILKAMAKDPDERFQDCGELLAGIRAYQGISEIRPPWSAWRLVGSAVVLSALLVGAGFVAYDLLFPDERRQIGAAQRESAQVLIRDLSERAGIACRELHQIEGFEKSRHLAREMGSTAWVDEYTKKIADMNKNVADWNAAYRNSIAKLCELDPALVADQFRSYGDALLKDQSFDKVKYVKLARRHYQQVLADRNSGVTLDRAACASNP